jgi:diketogulonate reductase-like aldo/keto reductase
VITDALPLNTGAAIPQVGFGTWQVSARETKQLVLAAIETGYRLIDTARIYGNEAQVGEAIRESAVPREQLFITTKLWNDDQGYDSALRACQASLERLGLDYLDLYLIHWPATPRRHDSWRAFEKLLADGLTRAAGVSNYTVEHLKELQERSDLTPAINQVEFHPFIYNQQRPVLEYCRSLGIVVEAYSPLRRLTGESFPTIDAIADRHGKSAQQVVLRWCIEQGTVPLTRSTKPKHIKSNFDIFDFKLTDQDMRELNSLSDGERVTWDPAGMG